MALIPLTPQSFAQAHWLPLPSAAFARTVSLVELNASELPAAACHLPVGQRGPGSKGSGSFNFGSRPAN